VDILVFYIANWKTFLYFTKSFQNDFFWLLALMPWKIAQHHSPILYSYRDLSKYFIETRCPLRIQTTQSERSITPSRKFSPPFVQHFRSSHFHGISSVASFPFLLLALTFNSPESGTIDWCVARTIQFGMQMSCWV
jgi:hypothetical protein